MIMMMVTVIMVIMINVPSLETSRELAMEPNIWSRNGFLCKAKKANNRKGKYCRNRCFQHPSGNLWRT